MDRFAKENAVEKINGYFSKRPGVTDTDLIAFMRAKKETIQYMQKALDNVKEITLADFAADRHTLARLD